jgi:hypothetical protein
VGFLAPQVRQELGALADEVHYDPLRVEVTGQEDGPRGVLYRGVLLDAPRFIDPAKLPIGCPVGFRAENVFPDPEASVGRGPL